MNAYVVFHAECHLRIEHFNLMAEHFHCFEEGDRRLSLSLQIVAGFLEFFIQIVVFLRPTQIVGVQSPQLGSQLIRILMPNILFLKKLLSYSKKFGNLQKIRKNN